jgi:site-specific DNA-methyltransferase (adenine-specific)
METENKIYSGDCLEILKTIETESVDLIITDPPYGTKTNQRDTFMIGEFSNIMPLVLPELFRVMKKDGGIYCFTSWTMMSDWLLRYQQYFKLQNIIIWDKERHSGCYSSQSWQFTWEGIFYGIKGKRPIRKYMRDVIKSDEKGRRIAMQKPVDVIEKLIIASSDEGQTILDPFSGTGSTLIACKNTNRKFIGIEINDGFLSLSKKRIHNVGGKFLSA